MVSELSSASNIQNCDENKAGRKRPSATCLHCDFRSDSPTVLTQHLWGKHPLRMRRKQHLFKSSNADKTQSQQKTNQIKPDDVKPMDIPSKDLQPKPTTTPAEAELNHQALEHVDSKELTSSTHQQEFVRKHLEMYSQINAVNINMFNNRCAVLIPSSQQFLSIPVATTSGLIQQLTLPVHPSHYSMDAYLSNAINLQMQQNKMNATSASVGRDVAISKGTVQRNQVSSDNVRRYEQHQTTVSKHKFRDSSDRQSDVNANVKYLTKKLISSAVCEGNKQHQTAGESKTDHWQYKNPSVRHNSKSHRKVNSETAKKKKVFSDNLKTFSKSSLIDNERMEALEEALSSVCFYDVNDTSSVMPFKCPDNVWRMVRFKSIRGVWLVQLPDSENPTLYVPFQKPGHQQTSLQESIQNALNSKNNNPLFKLFKSEKDVRIECPMIHPGTPNTKRPVHMFKNVEKSEVKAKRVQNSVKSGNVLRSLLAGNYQCTSRMGCKSAYDKKIMAQNFNSMSTYTSTVCGKNLVDAKAY